MSDQDLKGLKGRFSVTLADMGKFTSKILSVGSFELKLPAKYFGVRVESNIYYSRDHVEAIELIKLATDAGITGLVAAPGNYAYWDLQIPLFQGRLFVCVWNESGGYIFAAADNLEAIDPDVKAAFVSTQIFPQIAGLKIEPPDYFYAETSKRENGTVVKSASGKEWIHKDIEPTPEDLTEMYKQFYGFFVEELEKAKIPKPRRVYKYLEKAFSSGKFKRIWRKYPEWQKAALIWNACHMAGASGGKWPGDPATRTGMFFALVEKAVIALINRNL